MTNPAQVKQSLESSLQALQATQAKPKTVTIRADLLDDIIKAAAAVDKAGNTIVQGWQNLGYDARELVKSEYEGSYYQDVAALIRAQGAVEAALTRVCAYAHAVKQTPFATPEEAAEIARLEVARSNADMATNFAHSPYDQDYAQRIAAIQANIARRQATKGCEVQA